jgi:hypothetical protein
MDSVLNRNAVMKLAQQAAASLGLTKEKARPHELILALPLSASDDTYTFNLDAAIAEKVLPEITKGLEDRNSFIVIGAAIGFLPVPVIGGVEYPTAAAIEYHADANVFSEAAGTAILSEKQALESVHYGRISLKTNEGVRLDKMPMLYFRHVPQTQKGTATANQFTGAEVKPLGAAVRFGGGDDNEVTISIKCKDKTKIVGNASRKNYLVVRLVGSIIMGSTTKTFTR